MTNINCRVCLSPKTCDCLCSVCMATKFVMRDDSPTIDVTYYHELRRMGLRASSAFIIAKYGFDGLLSLLIDEEILRIDNV